MKAVKEDDSIVMEAIAILIILGFVLSLFSNSVNIVKHIHYSVKEQKHYDESNIKNRIEKFVKKLNHHSF